MVNEELVLMCERCKFMSENVDAFRDHQCSENDVELKTCSSANLSSSKEAPVFWSDNATKMLLSQMKEREEATKQGKTTKKKMWINITKELAKHGFNFTWEQVKGKWATLIAALKRTNDHNNRSGADKKTCTFQKELQEILHKNPSIQPVATSETSILKSGSKKKLGEAVAPLPEES